VVKEVVMGAALVVTLVTGADYVVRAVRLSKTPPDKADTVRARTQDGDPPGGRPPVPPDVREGRPDRKDGDRIRPPRTD
jgi:hypothetical protein